jgi:hypothetical protein
VKTLVLGILLLSATPAEAEGELGLGLGYAAEGPSLHLDGAWNPQGFWALAGAAAVGAKGELEWARAQFRLSLDIFRTVPRLGIFAGYRDGLSIGAEAAVDWFLNRHFALRSAGSIDHRGRVDARLGVVWLPWE